MIELKDKKILITGAGSGVGHALAIACLNAGAKVVACARNITSLSGIQDKNLLALSGDVADKTFIDELVQAASTSFGGIDVVVNNAGCMFYMDIKQPNYQQMEQMVKTNCLGMVNLIASTLPVLLNSPMPHWINITSDAGKRPFPGLAIYSGSKAFMEFTASAMRQELIQEGVKITNIQPGNINTPLQSKSTDKQAIDSYGSADVDNFLSPRDIVEAIMYTLSTNKKVAINELLIEPQSEPI